MKQVQQDIKVINMKYKKYKMKILLNITLLFLINLGYSQTVVNNYTNIRGIVSFESTDHRSNTYEVVNDQKRFDNNQFAAMIISHTDYYPYGMTAGEGNRSNILDNYRFGFQGQEKDDEAKGKGNSMNYKYRMHDSRIGRFFAVDPLSGKYPHYSSYQFSGNKVVNSVELEGLEEDEVILPHVYLKEVVISEEFHLSDEEIIDEINTKYVAPLNKTIQDLNASQINYMITNFNGNDIRTYYRDETTRPIKQYMEMTDFDGAFYSYHVESEIGLSGSLDLGVAIGGTGVIGGVAVSGEAALFNTELLSFDLSNTEGFNGYYMGKGDEYRISGGLAFSGGVPGMNIVELGANYQFNSLSGWDGDIGLNLNISKGEKKSSPIAPSHYDFSKSFKNNISPKIKVVDSNFSGLRLGAGLQFILGANLELRVGEKSWTLKRDLTRSELIDYYAKLFSGN